MFKKSFTLKFFAKKVSFRLFQAIRLLRFTSEKINILKHILNKYPAITLSKMCKRMRIQILYLSNNEKEHKGILLRLFYKPLSH